MRGAGTAVALVLLLVGCTSTSEEALGAARETCDRLTIYDDEAMGDMAAAVVIFDGFEQVEEEVSPDEFDDLLREECPEKMAAFDELVESGQIPEGPDDATD